MFEKVVLIDPRKLRFVFNRYKTHDLCEISAGIIYALISMPKGV